MENTCAIINKLFLWDEKGNSLSFQSPWEFEMYDLPLTRPIQSFSRYVYDAWNDVINNYETASTTSY